ncbi:10396_t:CDS:2 [Ambispora leptoticha]|uniref:10396_t:CDS:1 n=1 Tax=Ambispora leptoticha TaxID=144679 RepID=A0A9N9GPS9_9GLOM|nr:10396_t:CDS:2 [Ambispora leptoticha]
MLSAVKQPTFSSRQNGPGPSRQNSQGQSTSSSSILGSSPHSSNHPQAGTSREGIYSLRKQIVNEQRQSQRFVAVTSSSSFYSLRRQPYSLPARGSNNRKTT